MSRIGDWMQTYTGVQFWPMDPRQEEIKIEDIAHSLSNQCRYAGHCTSFYSVAQHSVLVSKIVPPEHQLWGLLHDASEAYLVDLPRPIKRYSRIGEEYKRVEAALVAKIALRFGLPIDEPKCISEADNIVLMTEKRDIMGPHPAKWVENAEPLVETIDPWSPFLAEYMFLQEYGRLTGSSFILSGTRWSGLSRLKNTQ
jgi:uncharacterized protein